MTIHSRGVLAAMLMYLSAACSGNDATGPSNTLAPSTVTGGVSTPLGVPTNRPIGRQLSGDPVDCRPALENVTLTSDRDTKLATLSFTVKPGYFNVEISLVTYVDILTSPTGVSGPPATSITELVSFDPHGAPQTLTIRIPVTTGTFIRHHYFHLIQARCGERMNMNGAFASTVFDDSLF